MGKFHTELHFVRRRKKCKKNGGIEGGSFLSPSHPPTHTPTLPTHCLELDLTELLDLAVSFGSRITGPSFSVTIRFCDRRSTVVKVLCYKSESKLHSSLRLSNLASNM